MKFSLIMLMASLTSYPCFATTRASANYTISTDTVDAGGRRATSGNYSNDGSTGGVPGIFTVASPAETTKNGYIGQLYDLTGLVVNAGPNADPSGNGQNNLFKYVAGLNPLDPNSRFALKVTPVPAQPGQKNLTFSPRFTDRTYVVKAKSNLLTLGGWGAISASAPSDNGTERTITDLNASGPAKFYHIGLRSPDASAIAMPTPARAGRLTAPSTSPGIPRGRLPAW